MLSVATVTAAAVASVASVAAAPAGSGFPTPYCGPTAGCQNESVANPAHWNGVWTTPPIRVPSSKSVDGPLLGDGEAGLVLGGSAPSGSGKVVVSAYLSSNTAWVLDKCTGGSCGRSHRAGIGGLEFAFETPRSRPEQQSFGLTFKQDLLAGTVGWFVWEESGVAPPPSPPPVPGCSIIGDWLQQGGSANASHIFPNGKNSSNSVSFL
jgi:hypothetical protein